MNQAVLHRPVKNPPIIDNHAKKLLKPTSCLFFASHSKWIPFCLKRISTPLLMINPLPPPGDSQTT
jgi:hypothetical protein